MALTEAIEEYVEKLFWFGEAGIEPTQANLARAMQVSQPSVTEMVRRLVDEGLVERDERKRLLFTAEGERVAKHIVSRHRLIEAYLVSEFGIPWDEVHEEAHTFEHAVSPRLEQLIYEKLPTSRRARTGTVANGQRRRANGRRRQWAAPRREWAARPEIRGGDEKIAFRDVLRASGARFRPRATANGCVRS